MVLRFITRPRVVLSWSVVVVLCAVLSPLIVYGSEGSYGLPFPAALYTLLLRKSPLTLLFTLAVALPYALPFSDLLRNRFVTYTRTRQSLRRTLAGHWAANATATFVTGFLIGLVPYLWVVAGDVKYAPEMYGLDTPAAVAEGELAWSTFTQLLSHGQWALPLAVSGWLGLNAVVWSSLAMCTVTLVRNRALSLSLPWVAWFAIMYVMAVLGLEAYSPNLIFPFNLEQMPLANLAVPLAGGTVVAACLTAWVFFRAPTLPGLQ
ncbi:MAG: hypothetical protein LBK42_00160 [Propionibacteriaceae bacterium]|jgi:hypothetical protein|nr:hypothetical protein [Propionibacteriaceae bacterium]